MATTAPPRPPLPATVRLLGWVSLLNDLASELIAPLLPSFFKDVLRGTNAQFGLIEGAADATVSLVQVWSGHRSDRARGRKGFLLVGYGLACLARPLVGLAAAPWQVLAIRVADRFGKGVRSAPRDALIADTAAPEQRGAAFGYHRSMDHLGAALGPLAATAFLLAWPEAFRPLFLLALAPGALVILLVALGLREPARPAPAAGPAAAPFRPGFWWFLAAAVLFALGRVSELFWVMRAGEAGVPRDGLPLLWCGYHVAKSVGTRYLGRAVDRVGPRPLLALGWVLYAGLEVAFAAATGVGPVLGLFLGGALFFALTEPAEKTLVAGLVGRDRRGRAFGLYQGAIGLAALPGGWLFGTLYDAGGPWAAFGLSAGLAVVAAGILALGRPEPAAPLATMGRGV